jgi:Ser/Thr protein kinase RdoA (MazF antagonist)
MKSTTFDSLTYKQQINAFKKLVLLAIEKYPLKVKEVKFIHYGENATFKITDTKNNSYLVRVCRIGYHSDKALNEELAWLSRLNKIKKLQVPCPVANKQGQLFTKVQLENVIGPTNLVLFEWTEGRFIENKFTLAHASQLGHLIGLLHSSVRGCHVKHRRYWNSDGLLSKGAKLGDLWQLGISKDKQQKILKMRKQLYAKLLNYEKKHPKKLGLIHADLHTGNFFFNKKGIVTIDFDDCGLGFFAYDLAIPFMVIDRTDKLSLQKKNDLKQAILKAYRQHCKFSALDEQMIEVCIQARMLTLLTWLNQRSSIPRLKKYFKVHLEKVLKMKPLTQ